MTGMTSEQIEEALLEALSQEPLSADSLVQLVCRMHDAEGVERANETAEMVREALLEARDGLGMLQLMRVWARWSGNQTSFRKLCEKSMTRAARDRKLASFIKTVGFPKDISVAEALDRITKLQHLAPGALCHDKTWGFGEVKRADEFYGKITIDFKSKPRHQMTFAYAAETLEVLSDDHLCTLAHSEPDAISRMIKEDPAEIVRLALRSFGPMSVPLLQECLEEYVLDGVAWKGFWDKARAQLKNDPLVDIPTKRTAQIQLLEREESFDDRWLAKLAADRSREGILEMLQSFELSGEKVPQEFFATIGERATFAIRGAETNDPVLVTKVMLVVERLQIPGEFIDLAPLALQLLNSGLFVECLKKLPVRDGTALLSLLLDYQEPQTLERIISMLPELPAAAIDEAVQALDARDRTAEWVARMRQLVADGKPGSFIMAWLVKHVGRAEDTGVAKRQVLFRVAVESLEVPECGERLQAQKAVRALFLDGKWLKDVLGDLAPHVREDLMGRVEMSGGWDSSARRSVLARMVKTFPELEDVLARRSADPEEKKQKARFTSWRSMRERQEQFRKLIEEDIPANSREIAVARSYGDLRENFEYQAAKDMQRMLLQRQDEMEQDLETVRGTDFAAVPTDCVGMGVEVEIECESGEKSVYRVLGEWDRDEDLNIISCRSLLAQRLMGRRVGDSVDVPSEGDDEPGLLTAVRPLSEEVMGWVSKM